MIEAVEGLNTLIDFRYQQHFKAGRGNHGQGRNKTGAAGRSVTIKVPVGTHVVAGGRQGKPGRRPDRGRPNRRCTGEAAATAASATPASRARPTGRRVSAESGLAGRGALALAAPQADRRRRADRPAERRQVELPEPPSPGPGRRSPTIPSPPFIPISAWSGLGDDSFVLADIPGLIEGAHDGAGLGDRFLGTSSAARVLLHLGRRHGEDVAGNYRHGSPGARRLRCRASPTSSEIVALNKIDALDEDEIAEKTQLSPRRGGGQEPVWPISGLAGLGVEPLLAISSSLSSRRAPNGRRRRQRNKAATGYEPTCAKGPRRRQARRRQDRLGAAGRRPRAGACAKPGSRPWPTISSSSSPTGRRSSWSPPARSRSAGATWA